MKLNKQQIIDFLPHRDPFLFLDTIESFKDSQGNEIQSGTSIKDQVSAGTVVTATFNCHKDLDLFRGHFPGRPIFPGVIQLEMMAQTSAFFVWKELEGRPVDSYELQVALLSLGNAKFRVPIIPDVKIWIRTRIKKIRGNIISYDAECSDSPDFTNILSDCDFLASYKIIPK